MMKTKKVNVLTTVLLFSLISSSFEQDSLITERPDTVRYYQQRAMVAYPELGKSDSAFNKRFLAAYNELIKANDPILSQVDWPLLVADYVARSSNQTSGNLGESNSTGIVSSLRNERAESERQAHAAQAAQAAQNQEIARQQKLAELKRNSVVLRGKVSQIVDDGIIMDAEFLDGYDSEVGRNAPMIVRNLDGSINPQQSGFTPRYRTEQLFLLGHPQRDSLIDGADIAVIAAPVGAYHFTTVMGAVKTIRSWMVLKSVDAGQ